MRIAVVIPCFRVKDRIHDVLAGIGPECDAVYVVDDACPEHTGAAVRDRCRDPRVRVLELAENRGVGGATLAGYQAALEDGAEIVVKLDGDGQMDPGLIPRLVGPIVQGDADYTKGNRFFDLEGITAMPVSRLIGNSLLSFASKVSTGYWNLFDPTNGFTAIHAAVARELPRSKISPRWFFESDLLFRLGTLRAVVTDIPMPARYGDERSSLVVHRVIPEFVAKHTVNTVKRLFYGYLLRSVNVATLEGLLGGGLLAFGTWVGVTRWVEGSSAGVERSSGTVMLAALPIILGAQLLLAFLSYDLQNIPREVLHRRLAPRRPPR